MKIQILDQFIHDSHEGASVRYTLVSKGRKYEILRGNLTMSVHGSESSAKTKFNDYKFKFG